MTLSADETAIKLCDFSFANSTIAVIEPMWFFKLASSSPFSFHTVKLPSSSPTTNLNKTIFKFKIFY